jgi:hypothetical protein
MRAYATTGAKNWPVLDHSGQALSNFWTLAAASYERARNLRIVVLTLQLFPALNELALRENLSYFTLLSR